MTLKTAEQLQVDTEALLDRTPRGLLYVKNLFADLIDSAPTLAGWAIYRYPVEAYGDENTGNGTQDDTAAIHAAIAAAGDAGAGEVILGPKLYRTTGIWLDRSHVVLRGVGGGQLWGALTIGTRIQALATTTIVLRVGPPDGAANQIDGCGISGIDIDGAGIATHGLVVGGVTRGIFERWSAHGCTTMQARTVWEADVPTSGLGQTYACTFRDFSLHCGTSAKGFSLDGKSGGCGVQQEHR